MAHGLDSTKTPARPSHEAIEGRGAGDEKAEVDGGSHKLDDIAMRSAKRAQNRIHDDEEKIPGSTIFSK
jgi:hypothetical protein